MKENLHVYPGKVLQYPRSVQHKELDVSLRQSLEDLSLYQHQTHRDKKQKLSLRLVRRLSRLLSPQKEDPYHVSVPYDPVDVHVPTRSRSLDGEQRVLSRKQILASLEEQTAARDYEIECQPTYSLYGKQNQPAYWTVSRPRYWRQEQFLYRASSLRAPSRYRVPAIQDPGFYTAEQVKGMGENSLYMLQDSLEELREEWEDSRDHSGSSFSVDSISGSQADSDTAFGQNSGDSLKASSSFSSENSSDSELYSSEPELFSGDRFSRCELIQSISKEEMRLREDRTAEDQALTEEANENCVCNKRKVSVCDNAGVGDIELSDLSWVGTLGVGGFGRVELVTAGLNNNLTFALKKLKKQEIKDEKQQQHIINEKNIMLSCSSPFVVKLYRTFRDTRYLYMLMEPCLGGELWTILRDKKRFEDSSARFYTGCVIKALEYLHEKGIVYRDLKPENLLLDGSGYVKLTDFGFSKRLAPGEKSWTFCGTPEYVAPEIITNKSHDFRADIWSVGILMYELLNGVPPFSKANNATSSQVYTEILKGMKGVKFPQYMSATSVELIRQLCRISPAQRPSLNVTRRFMWFAGMDWTGLENRTLKPPFLPKITGAKDTSNFDNYVQESAEPAEDFSTWDKDF